MTNDIPKNFAKAWLFDDAGKEKYLGTFQRAVEEHEMQIQALKDFQEMIEERDATFYKKIGHDGYIFVAGWVQSQIDEMVACLEEEKQVCEWHVLMIERNREIYMGAFYHILYWHEGDHMKPSGLCLIPALMVEHFGGVEEALRVELKDEKPDLLFTVAGKVDRHRRPVGGETNGK